jgi:hypothetical protein
MKDNALASVALQRLLETGHVIELKYKKQRLCLHSAHLPQQSAQVRHSQETSDKFLFDCRVALLDKLSHMAEIEWQPLEEALKEFLNFEKQWNETVRLKDVNHPLLLPPPSFKAHSTIQNYWKECDVYWETRKLTRVKIALQAVEARHRKTDSFRPYWLDSANKHFQKDPNPHAMTPEERQGRQRFRFCFPIPVGFHFDVKHQTSQSFWLTDHNKAARNIQGHANVDPWGRIRD